MKKQTAGDLRAQLPVLKLGFIEERSETRLGRLEFADVLLCSTATHTRTRRGDIRLIGSGECGRFLRSWLLDPVG